MYNADKPSADELPSSGQLLRSTAIALVVAAVLLVTVVLPAEYGIDPTGAGRILGLTEMGEIKTQLAEEAAADAHGSTAAAAPAPPSVEAARLDAIARQLGEIMTAVSALQKDNAAARQEIAAMLATPKPVEQAAPPAAPDDVAETAQPAEPVAEESEAAPASAWRDEIEITLEPGQGVEFKLVMAENAEAEFEWTANGSVLNYDTHGDGSGNSISYEKGRGVAEQAGVLRAAFSGNHGWFWRNRTDAPVTLTLRTRGDYSEFKRTV